jgi:amidophosphoribosyltransferase
VAANRTEEEVCKYIGADWLIYQDLEDLIGSVRYDNSDIDGFDSSCFSGQYVTGDVTPEYLHHLEVMRSDEAKSGREALRQKLEDDIDIDAEDDDMASDSHAGIA